MVNRKLPDLEVKNILENRIIKFMKAHRYSNLSDEAVALLITDMIPSELKDVQKVLSQIIDSQFQVICSLLNGEDKVKHQQYIQDCIDKNYDPSPELIEYWREIRDDDFCINNKGVNND